MIVAATHLFDGEALHAGLAVVIYTLAVRRRR